MPPVVPKIDNISLSLFVRNIHTSDKTAINTKAVQNPNFIKEASKVFGSQCIVSSIDAKKKSKNKWEVYVDNGREPTGMDVVEWAKKVETLGAGEIMLTSIDIFDITIYDEKQIAYANLENIYLNRLSNVIKNLLNEST